MIEYKVTEIVSRLALTWCYSQLEENTERHRERKNIISTGGFVTQVNKLTVNSILYSLATGTVLKALLGNRPWTRPSFFNSDQYFIVVS